VTLQWLTMGYIRRKQFEGMANLSAMGRAVQQQGQGERVSPEAMIAMMGGFS